MTTGTFMTVMAHADDAELWAGGTIAAHTLRGGHAIIAVPRHSDVRDTEAVHGAKVLGARLRLLDDAHPDTLAALLRDFRPEVVVTHLIDDIHPEHRAIADTVLTVLPDVVIATGYPKRLYTCDGYNNLDRHGRPVPLPVIIDVTTTFDTKTTALACHASQPITEHFGPMGRSLAQLHGHRIGVSYAEAFRPAPVLGRLPATPHL